MFLFVPKDGTGAAKLTFCLKNSAQSFFILLFCFQTSKTGQRCSFLEFFKKHFNLDLNLLQISKICFLAAVIENNVFRDIIEKVNRL